MTPNYLALHRSAITFAPACRMNFRKLKQQGVTLVELMIALGIGTLIALAISTLFFQVFSGYRSTDDSARATESGTFGLRLLTEDLRLSGFVGLFDNAAGIAMARPAMISGSPADNCGNPAWLLPLDVTTNRVNKREHITNPTTLPCIPAASVFPGSPAIVVRGADGVLATAADMASNRVLIQSSQTGAIIFMGNDYAAQVLAPERNFTVCRYTPGAGACNDVAHPSPFSLTPFCRCPRTGANANTGTVALVDGPIFRYHAHVYYIRPCSRFAPGQTSCTNAADGGEPIPTLVRRQLSDSDPAVFVETPIAEGVERLNVSYGLDTDGNGVVDTYTDSATVAAANLGNALTARVSLLMRTRKPENKGIDQDNTYTLADHSDTNPSKFNCGNEDNPLCKHRRYLLTDTVQFKN